MSPLRLPLFAAFVATSSIIVISGASFGCNRSGAQLREAASADLHCPKSRIHIVGASKTKDVEACGQRATYRFEDGDWVMISREGAAPVPGPAQVGQSPQPIKGGPPGVTPAQPVMTATGTPSMPPSSPPPPSQPPAAGQKAL